MRELSIFIDESGDFGKFNHHSPYYIISLVFHDQDVDISNNILTLDNKLAVLNLHNNCIHTAPIVRGEESYQNLDITLRRKILLSFISFVKRCNISYKCFYIEKKHIKEPIEVYTKLTKQLSIFIKDNLEYFNNYDIIKIYYDNGQIELTKIFTGVFNALFSNPVFNIVAPSSYKLFQAADLFCYFKLVSLKSNSKCMSMSEKRFFESAHNLYRMYIKQFYKLEFKKEDY